MINLYLKSDTCSVQGIFIAMTLEVQIVAIVLCSLKKKKCMCSINYFFGEKIIFMSFVSKYRADLYNMSLLI